MAYKLRGRPIVIGVEGLIGAGKTTFIRGLEESGLTVIEEPVQQWQDMSIGLENNDSSLSFVEKSERNVMQNYNNNPSKYGYVFQSLVFITKVHNIIKNWHKSNVIIVERSPLCDKNVFASMLHNNKIINNTEWLAYNHWYQKMMESYNVYPDELIYLKVDVNQAMARVKKRGRPEEVNVVDQKYLEDLHVLHENWLNGNSINILWKDESDPSRAAKQYYNKINDIAVNLATRIVIKHMLDL